MHAVLSTDGTLTEAAFNAQEAAFFGILLIRRRDSDLQIAIKRQSALLVLSKGGDDSGLENVGCPRSIYDANYGNIFAVLGEHLLTELKLQSISVHADYIIQVRSDSRLTAALRLGRQDVLLDRQLVL